MMFMYSAEISIRSTVLCILSDWDTGALLIVHGFYILVAFPVGVTFSTVVFCFIGRGFLKISNFPSGIFRLRCHFLAYYSCVSKATFFVLAGRWCYYLAVVIIFRHLVLIRR